MWFSETPGPTVAASPETAQKLLETLSNRSHSNQINQTLQGGHSSPFQQALQVILMKASLEIRQRLGHFSSVRNGPGILGDAGVLGQGDPQDQSEFHNMLKYSFHSFISLFHKYTVAFSRGYMTQQIACRSKYKNPALFN